MKTYEPGIYPGLSFEDYCKADGINASLLKQADDCPAAAEWYMRYGAESTSSMTLGSAIHAAVLEPESFQSRFTSAEQCGAVTGKGEPCANGGKVLVGGVWYCGVHGKGKVSDDTREAIPARDFRAAQWVADRVLADAKLAPVIHAKDAIREVSMFWIDGPTGQLCKARADLLVPSLRIAFDLKSTSGSARPDGVKRSVRRYRYDIQAAHYLAGCSALSKQIGAEIDAFLFGFVDTKPPHVVTPLGVGDDALAVAELRRRRAIETLIECDAAGFWPGYVADDDDLPILTADDLQFDILDTNTQELDHADF